jgi:hypothetical protein
MWYLTLIWVEQRRFQSTGSAQPIPFFGPDYNP